MLINPDWKPEATNERGRPARRKSDGQSEWKHPRLLIIMLTQQFATANVFDLNMMHTKLHVDNTRIDKMFTDNKSHL